MQIAKDSQKEKTVDEEQYRKESNKHGGAQGQLNFSQIAPKNGPQYYGGRVSKDELAKHYKKDDCWTAIDGKVYDITEYIQFHPGGNKILAGAGRDGTVPFSKLKRIA